MASYGVMLDQAELHAVAHALAMHIQRLGSHPTLQSSLAAVENAMEVADVDNFMGLASEQRRTELLTRRAQH